MSQFHFAAVCAVGAGLVGGAALAQTTAPTPALAAQPRSAPAKPAKPKLICHHEEVTGSRLEGKTTCMTADEWADNARQSADALQGFQNRGGFVPGGSLSSGGH